MPFQSVNKSHFGSVENLPFFPEKNRKMLLISPKFPAAIAKDRIIASQFFCFFLQKGKVSCLASSRLFCPLCPPPRASQLLLLDPILHVTHEHINFFVQRFRPALKARNSKTTKKAATMGDSGFESTRLSRPLLEEAAQVISPCFRSNSSLSRRVASRSNMMYFMSKRNWTSVS